MAYSHHGSLSCKVLASLIIRDVYLLLQMSILLFNGLILPGSHHGSLSCKVLASLIIRDVCLLLQMSILLFNGLILPGVQWLTATMAA